MGKQTRVCVCLRCTHTTRRMPLNTMTFPPTGRQSLLFPMPTDWRPLAQKMRLERKESSLAAAEKEISPGSSSGKNTYAYRRRSDPRKMQLERRIQHVQTTLSVCTYSVVQLGIVSLLAAKHARASEANSRSGHSGERLEKRKRAPAIIRPKSDSLRALQLGYVSRLRTFANSVSIPPSTKWVSHAMCC